MVRQGPFAFMDRSEAEADYIVPLKRPLVASEKRVKASGLIS